MTDEDSLAEAREAFMAAQDIVETRDGCLRLVDDDPLEMLPSVTSDTALCRWHKPEGDVELWMLARLPGGWNIWRLWARDEPPDPPAGRASGRGRGR